VVSGTVQLFVKKSHEGLTSVELYCKTKKNSATTVEQSEKLWKVTEGHQHQLKSN
jgi:hypothetical protein